MERVWVTTGDPRVDPWEYSWETRLAGQVLVPAGSIRIRVWILGKFCSDWYSRALGSESPVGRLVPCLSRILHHTHHTYHFLPARPTFPPTPNVISLNAFAETKLSTCFTLTISARTPPIDAYWRPFKRVELSSKPPSGRIAAGFKPMQAAVHTVTAKTDASPMRLRHRIGDAAMFAATLRGSCQALTELTLKTYGTCSTGSIKFNRERRTSSHAIWLCFPNTQFVECGDETGTDCQKHYVEYVTQPRKGLAPSLAANAQAEEHEINLARNTFENAALASAGSSFNSESSNCFHWSPMFSQAAELSLNEIKAYRKWAFPDALGSPDHDPFFSVENALAWMTSSGYQLHALHDDPVISSSYWTPEDASTKYILSDEYQLHPFLENPGQWISPIAFQARMDTHVESRGRPRESTPLSSRAPSFPSTFDVPRIPTAIFVDLSASEHLLKTSRGKVMHADKFIRAEKQESWERSSGHSTGDFDVFGFTSDPTEHPACTGVATLIRLHKPSKCGKEYFVGCSKWTRSEQGRHLAWSIPANIDEDVPRFVIDNDGQLPNETVTTNADCVLTVHPRVTLNHCLLLDTLAYSHIINGRIKPGRIEKLELGEAVASAGVTGLTIQKLLNAPTTSSLYGGKRVMESSPAFADPRKVRDFISATKKVENPHGWGWDGLVYHVNTKEAKLLKTERYIHTAMSKNDFRLVITTHPQIAVLIHRVLSLKINFTFKRVEGKMDEWEVIGLVERVQKRYTWPVFTATRQTGTLLPRFFPSFFLIQSPISAKHKALAIFLAKYNNANISNIWTSNQFKLLLHCLKTCDLHFESLEGTGNSNIWCLDVFQDWYRHKFNNPWILPSINKSLSKISSSDWDLTPNHSNYVENAHPARNAETGTQKLIAGIAEAMASRNGSTTPRRLHNAIRNTPASRRRRVSIAEVCLFIAFQSTSRQVKHRLEGFRGIEVVRRFSIFEMVVGDELEWYALAGGRAPRASASRGSFMRVENDATKEPGSPFY
ncbi:hypothetical protein B0H14DRAFT_2607365 [Mycena olivaceomarginata]|nr:hypothetical protein B0H14DRAFT_2607365 [Mycena olivaceomarginata]